jgi:peptidoglycan/xylan/chitin deacetylase (PgdA/CDA1 family)
LVSFDDGFKNNLTLAAPLLAKYKIPAAVFVTTDYIGTSGQLFWALELSQRLMNSDEDSVTLSGITYPLPDTSHSERSSSVIIITNATKKIPANERQIFLEDVRSKTDYDISAPWQKELYEFLTWDEVRTLRKQGIEIGCHTASHPILSALNPDELDRELRESKKKIEQELGEECDTIVYHAGLDTQLIQGDNFGYKRELR